MLAMNLQMLFYAELETFVLKCNKFNSKILAPLSKISGCATEQNKFYFIAKSHINIY